MIRLAFMLSLLSGCKGACAVPSDVGAWRMLEAEAEGCHAVPGEVEGCLACFARVSAECRDAGLSDCNFYDSSEPNRSCF